MQNSKTNNILFLSDTDKTEKNNLSELMHQQKLEKHPILLSPFLVSSESTFLTENNKSSKKCQKVSAILIQSQKLHKKNSLKNKRINKESLNINKSSRKKRNKLKNSLKLKNLILNELT